MKDRAPRARPAQFEDIVGDSLAAADRWQLEFDEAVAWSRGNWATLIATYAGRYAAVLNDEIVDSDIDRVRLSERIYHRYGNRPLYMPYVGAQAKEPAHGWRPRRRLQ